MITPRSDVALRPGYHSPQVDVRVRLNTNESPFPPPDEWLDDVLREAAMVHWNRYPDRSAIALRTAIGALHGLGPEWVFAANGSNEVLQTVLLAFGGPGRTAALWEPTYALHSHLAETTSTQVVVGERGADFALDVDEIRRVITEAGPSVVFLCSPNNPTGVADSPALVEEVLAMARSGDALLVVDEAYGQFSGWSATSLLGEGEPLVVVRTYSKTWAMAGLRLGYLVGPPEVVNALEKVVLPYHLDTLKQAIGLAALSYETEMRARVEQLVAERERVQAALAAMDVDYWRSGANFVLFRPRRVAGQAVWNALLSHSILVRDCSSWPRLDGCLRVTIGAPAENDAFIEALAETLEKMTS